MVETECAYDRTVCLSPAPKPCMALAGGKLAIRFFVRADTPTKTNLNIRFNPAITDRLYKADMMADFQDRSIILPKLSLPDRATRIFFPDRINLQIGDFRYRTRLPTFELLPRERFFEYIVSQQLERLGFQCDWLSKRNPRFPNVKAIFKPIPPPEGEVFHVECTIQRPYDSKKFYADFGKFTSERNSWKPKFTRLLIIPSYDDLTEDVSRKLSDLSEPVSVITYPTLVQLFKQVERGLMDKHKAYELLQRPGEIRISRRVSADTLIPDTLTIIYAFTLRLAH